MTAQKTARHILAVILGFCVAAIALRALSKDAQPERDSEPAEARLAHERQARKPPEHRTVDRRPPAIEVVSIEPKVSRRELMIKENPHAGSVTWAEIARAEHELIQPLIAIYLGDGHEIGLDCFELDRISPEFSYELSVAVTPDSVSVGGFRITQSELPGQTKDCLENLFAGTVTLDLPARFKHAGLYYMPVNTTLWRESNFVNSVTRDLVKYGREHVMKRTQASLLNTP